MKIHGGLPCVGKDLVRSCQAAVPETLAIPKVLCHGVWVYFGPVFAFLGCACIVACGRCQKHSSHNMAEMEMRPKQNSEDLKGARTWLCQFVPLWPLEFSVLELEWKCISSHCSQTRTGLRLICLMIV